MEQTDSTLSQLMFSLIEVWKQSGMTRKDFCAEKDIALPKFQYWIKKYVVRHERPGDFVPVKLTGSGTASPASKMEVLWPDGKRVIFHAPVEASFLKAGGGWNERIGIQHFRFSTQSRIYGPRVYGEYKMIKGFALRAEVETMNTYIPPDPILNSDPSGRRWVCNSFAGLRRDYKIFKRGQHPDALPDQQPFHPALPRNLRRSVDCENGV